MCMRAFFVKKHRIATTISQKHWDLLTKQVGKYKTQQKVLEIALENLDNSSKQDPVLTDKEQVWLAILRENLVVLYEKSCFKSLMENSDIECQTEFFEREKPVEVSIEFFYKEPLSAMSLKEVLDGLIFNAKLSNWYDTVECIDEDSHYTVVMVHNLGINCSKTTLLMVKSALSTYGAKTESIISPKSVFVKVFKS